MILFFLFIKSSSFKANVGNWILGRLVKPIIRLHQVECVPQVSTSSTSIPSTSRLWNCWVSQVPTRIVGGLEMFATIPTLPAQDADCAAKSANQCNVARSAGRTINLWICPAPTFIVSDGGVLYQPHLPRVTIARSKFLLPTNILEKMLNNPSILFYFLQTCVDVLILWWSVDYRCHYYEAIFKNFKFFEWLFMFVRP